MIGRLIGWVARAALALAAIRLAGETLRSPASAAGAPSARPGRSGVARWIVRAIVLLTIGAIGGAVVMVSGIVPIKASSGHWSITETVLQFAKRRSVAAHSMLITPPSLDDPRLVAIGAGHYDFACRPCHGSPAVEQPRIARQMLPRPPDLRASAPRYDPEDLFYIVKHGIKLTGMPAWPSLQRDDEVWAVVSFLRKLPHLEAGQYTELARGELARPDAGMPMEDLLGPHDLPRAIADNCSRCHGLDGLGRANGAFPKLAGQRPEYLLASMDAYARGQRHSGIMEPVAATLGSDEMREIARYYAGRPAGSSSAANTAAGDAIALGRTIANDGVPERLVPACVSCHGPGGRPRNPTYPLLSGQYAEYLALQLRLFKEDRRGGTAYRGIMTKVARQLTPDQIEAVAAYYASLPGGS